MVKLFNKQENRNNLGNCIVFRLVFWEREEERLDVDILIHTADKS